MFNLPPTSRHLKDTKFEERAIINNVAVCCYGKLMNISDQYLFQPKIIIGNKHESMLVFLDEHIMGLNRKGKLCAGLGLALMAGHALYKFNNPSRKRGVVDMEI